MVNVQGDFYDYNGVLFCHGIVTDTGSYDCNYVIMTIDSGYKYKSYVKDPDNFPGVFNVNTYSHAINSSPTTLSSGTHEVYLEFYTAAGELILGSYLYSNSSRIDYNMHNSLYSPSLSYDAVNKTITVTNEGTGRYYLEIRRKDRNKVNTAYSETEKDYFYTTLMRGTEGGKYYEGVPHTSFVEFGYTDEDGNLYEPIPKARYQWLTEIPTIILFDSDANFTDSEKEAYYSLACEALDDLTKITGKKFTERAQETRKGDTDFSTCVTNDWSEYYYSRDEQYYNMIIRFGKEDTMYLGGQGKWSYYAYYDPIDGIETSHPSIAVDVSAEIESVKHVVYEEVMQSLGMGNDSHSQETSLHWDPHYSNPESYSGIDKRILELVCSEDVCGWSGFNFLNKWDTPCVLYKDYTGSDLVFDVSELNENEDYYAWAWIARKGSGGGVAGGSIAGASATNGSGTSVVADGWDDSPYSMRTQIEFSTKLDGTYPGEFQWTYEKQKGIAFNLTAEEWNRLQLHIERMLAYKLGDTQGYSPDSVSTNEVFYASKYNEAGNAIKLISGYGTFIPVVLPKQNITADDTSDIPSDDAMNVIVRELNAIPED